MKHGKAYVEAGAAYYETQYRNRVLANLKKKAKRLRYELVANPVPESPKDYMVKFLRKAAAYFAKESLPGARS